MTMCGVVSNRLFAPSPALEEVTQPEDDTLTVDQLVLPKSQAAPIGDGGSGGGETFSGGDSVGCMNFFGDLGAAVGQLAGERWGESEPASTFGQEVGSLVGSQLGSICDWTLPGTQDPGPDASIDPLPAAAPPPSSTDPCVTQEREAPGNACTGISQEPAGASAPNSSNATTGDTSTAPTTGAQSSTSTSANGSGSPSASSSSSTPNSSNDSNPNSFCSSSISSSTPNSSNESNSSCSSPTNSTSSSGGTGAPRIPAPYRPTTKRAACAETPTAATKTSPTPRPGGAVVQTRASRHRAVWSPLRGTTERAEVLVRSAPCLRSWDSRARPISAPRAG